MNVSAAGRKLIADFEGCRLKAYDDATGLPVPEGGKARGILTIGVGHIVGVYPGQTITQAEADALLASDLAIFEQAVGRAIGPAETSQHELDAMVSLAFNIGAEGFRTSTVCRLHKAGDKQGAARAFGLWNKVTRNGVLEVSPGLVRRRAAETAHYLTPDVPSAEPMPQAVEPPKSAISSKTVIAGTVAAATGTASAVDQISKATDTLTTITTFGASVNSLIQLGAAALAVIAVAAGGYMLWRYIQKLKSGQAVST